MTTLDPVSQTAGVVAFVTECCEVNRGSGSTGELYASYEAFCWAMNRPAISRVRFFEVLETRGYKKQGRWIRSLRVAAGYRVADESEKHDPFATPVSAFIKTMAQKGIKMRAEGGRVTVWRSGALTDDDRDYLTAQRDEVARVLSEDLVARASNLLPSWFVPHMALQKGTYGLLLASGQLFPIEQILDVEASADGGVWLDVLWLDAQGVRDNRAVGTLPTSVHVLFAPKGGSETSLNAAGISAALDFEPQQRGEMF